MAKRRRTKKSTSRKKHVIDALMPFSASSDVACDACGAPRSHHVPLCAEVDPRLITFWASLCERCLGDGVGGNEAYKNIRARGWARADTVLHAES